MKHMIRFSCGLVLLTLGLLMTGCQKSGNYYDVIPKDASVVVAVNAQNIMEKGDIIALLQNLRPMLESGTDGQTLQQVEAILNNTTESGIALNEKVFVFGMLEQQAGGIVMKVNNENKLTELFTTLQKEGICEIPVKADGFYQTTLKDGVLCAYDKNRLLIMLAEMPSTRKVLGQWMDQPVENSIASGESFQKMIAQPDDLSFMMVMGDLYKLYAARTGMEISGVIDMSKLDMLGGITFEKGRITSHFGYFLADKAVMEQYKQQMSIYGKLNNSFLECFPASALLYMTANVNGEKLYKLLETYNFWQTLKIAPGNDQIDVQKLTGSFAGDFSMGLLNVTETGFAAVTAYAQVNDNYPVQALAGLAQQFSQYADLKAIGTDAYEVNIRMLNMKIWFGLQDKYLYLTNDRNIYEKIGQKVADPLSESSQATNLKGAYSAFILNVDALMQLPVVQMMWGALGSYNPILKNILSECEYIESYATTPIESTVNIYVKNKEENVLKLMVQGGQRLAL